MTYKTWTRCLAFVCAASATCAADRTWSGGSGTDSYWSLAANWGGTVPAAGDSLFFAGSARTSNSNDISAGLAISGIQFNVGAGAFALGGSGITLNGSISNFSANTQTLNLPMELSGIRTIYGSNTDFNVNGVLSGPGGLYLDSTNKTIYLTGNNTYDGQTTVTNGRLWIKHANALGNTGAGTVVWGRGNGNLTLSGNMEFAEPLTLKGQILPWMASLTCNSGSNVLTGPVYKEIDGRIRVESGSNKLIFRGGLIHVNGGQVALNPATGAELIFLDKPLSFGTAASVLTEEGGTVIFGVPGNTFSQLQIGNQSKVRTDVSNAIPPGCTLVIGASWAQNGLFNMNGFDATVAQLRTDANAANPGYLAITSAAPATLTVNQGGNTVYAGALAGAVRLIKNGGGTLTFTNASSTTSGEIVLNAGTIAIAEVGGGFTNSASIRVNGGILELRNGAALSDDATLRVLEGGKIKIKDGVTETVGTLFLDGEQQVSGTWGATGSGADHINDVFFTGLGKLNVVSGTQNVYADALWDGGGADTRLTTAENWADNTLPSFDGYARAVFASGGDTAAVDTAASFVKMSFLANTNFTVASGAGVITNGGGGLKAGVPTTTSRTYTIAEDLVLGDHQFWSITNNGSGTTTLNVTGSISDGSNAFNLTKRGNGVLVLAGDNAYTGKTTIQTNGYAVLKHGHALGSTAGITEIENGGYIRIDGPSGGLVIDEPITMTGDQALNYGGTLRSNTGSNIWTGKITSNGARLRCESGACFEIQGGVDGSSLVCSAYGTRWIRFTEKPISTAQFTSHTGDGGVIIAVTGNTFSAFNACGYFVRIDVPNAWPPTCSLTQGDGGNGASVLNLNGNDQTVGLWQTQRDNADPRVLFSVAPATLTVNQNANSWFGGSITGAVSIVKLGTGNLALTNRFTTTSGHFTVSNGTLTAAHFGTFGPNSTNIVVGGTGTLLLSNSVAIADSAVLKMPAAGTSSAKVSLASGVNEAVGWLFYGGKMMRGGTYGSTASPAEHKDDTHFAGSGVLTVLHDQAGLIFFLR